MRISRFSKRGTEEITFALWKGEKITDLIVYKENPSDTKVEAYIRREIAVSLDMLAADGREISWKEIDELVAKIRAIKVHFI